MPGATTETIGGILKTVYEDFVADQVLNRFPLKDAFRWEQVEYAGQEVVYNAHVSRNISPMFCGEDTAFAEAGVQGSLKVHIGQRKLMARIRLTSEAMQDSMRSEGAFKSARRDEMSRLIDDIANMEEFALSTDGRGVLALVNSATPSASATLPVDSPGGIAGPDFGNRFILPGMYVGFVNPSTGALRAGVRKVVSCSDDGLTITLDAAPGASVADNDYIVHAANANVTDVLDTSYEHAFWGVMALFDDGTYRNNYFNVDRSQWQAYQSYVRPSTGTLSADLFQQVSDVMDQKLGGVTRVLMGHHSVRRLYLALTEADRRYTAENLMKPDVGTVAFKQGDLTVGQVPFKAIRTFPLATLMGVDTEGAGLVVYGSERGKWVDEDGQVFVRVGTGSSARDAYEAWYRIRKQYHARYPGKAWRLDGITGQSLIVVRPAGS
jgi:hypothetical protein